MNSRIRLSVQALIIASGILWSAPVCGQRPSTPRPSQQRMRGGFPHIIQPVHAARRSGIGASYVNPKTIFKPGMGWVSAIIGDYVFTIGCITAKDVIVFFCAGLDEATALEHVQSVGKNMTRSH